MKLLLKILLIFMIPFLLNAQTPCSDTCKIIVDVVTGQPTGDLNCTLPKMDTFPITAPNVLNTDGTLKKFFDTNNTVCDVLGWMNTAVPFIDSHYGGMNMQVREPLTLLLEHLDTNSLGGSTGKSQITLDTDTYDAGTDDFTNENDPDGNIHKHRMKYITVHEFLHFVAFNTSDGSRELWLQEGMARNFEDVV